MATWLEFKSKFSSFILRVLLIVKYKNEYYWYQNIWEFIFNSSKEKKYRKMLILGAQVPHSYSLLTIKWKFQA